MSCIEKTNLQAAGEGFGHGLVGCPKSGCKGSLRLQGLLLALLQAS